MAADHIKTDRDLLVALTEQVKAMRADVAEIKRTANNAATCDYVDLKVSQIRNKQTDTTGLGSLLATRTGVIMFVLVSILAVLGLMNILAQPTLSADEIQQLVRDTVFLMN